MKSIIARVMSLLIFLLATAFAQAQGAPAQIDTALLDLSARLGYGIGISNLENWRWEQANFPDSALGCPAFSGSGDAVLGYKFELTYNAITYDYRVSADSASVVFCGEIDPHQASAAPAADYSNRLCDPEAPDGPYMRSRISYGMEVEVLGGYLNLRGQPSVNGQALLQIPAGLPFLVTAGPDCVDGYVWWLAIVNGQTGYIAEAGDGAYFVEPKRPAALPNRQKITRSLAPYLREVARVSGNFLPQHSWSADSRYLALPGAAGSDSLWLYDLQQPILKPQTLAFDEGGIAALAFRPASAQLLIGSDAGILRLWQIVAGETFTYTDRLSLNVHAGPVTALAFGPDGQRFVSAGGEAYTHVPVDREFAAVVWDLPTVAQQAVLSGHQGFVRALAFSPDGQTLVSGADDGTLRFWDAQTGANTGLLDFSAPIFDLAYSADGRLIAVAVGRAVDNLLLVDAAARSISASYPLPTRNLSAVAFSPDSSMLLAGAADGGFSLWDTVEPQLLVAQETAGDLRQVHFSPDGTLISVSLEDKSLLLYGLPVGSG